MTAHRVAWLALALIAATPAAAHAGTVSRDGTIVRWTASPGEANRITIQAAGGVLVADAGAPLTPGNDCAPVVGGVLCADAGVTAIVFDAGDGNDFIESESAIPATLIGGLGDDELAGGAGPDAFQGGPDYDVVSYEFHGEPVTAAIDGTPGSGAATDGLPGARDTIALDVETLWGSAGSDRLTGSAEDNILWGGDGADVLTGGAGDDIVDFSDRASGVTVALDGTPVSGNDQDGPPGARDTVAADIEGVFGGSGADVLTGNAAQNLLDGALGDDRIEARDGVRDSVLCGPGSDTAIIDTLDERRDCESEQLPQPAPSPTPTPRVPTAPRDTFAPRVTLRPATRQRLATLLSRGLSVQVTCSESCRLSAELRADARTAKRLKLRSRLVGKATATRAGRIVVRFSADARKRLRAARVVELTLRVVATDTAGNTATVSRKVRLSRAG